ncbi:hypothetical protein L6164_003184 [Bauhinia variegata]|uniref:Uncharacterized protein n=1 Tax=Bauhinia variegata TaxID=167791 RepID=A0ACB9Q0J4_BAUVA|nr:hypothetical protein L6164_003184 [Bauhinia variegata]
MYFMYVTRDAQEARWKELCNERIERLKSVEFPSVIQPSQPPLVLEEFSISYKFLAPELYKAAKNGDIFHFLEILELVSSDKKLSLSSIFNQVTPGGDSLLHVAAKYGTKDVAQFIALEFPELLMRRNTTGDTALHVAAKSKNSEVISTLLSCFADYYIKKSKSLTRVKGLILLPDGIEDEEVVTRIKNECRNTALHEAVMRSHEEEATMLFQADQVVATFLNKEFKSSMYLAVEINNRRVLWHLLQAPFPRGRQLTWHQGNSPLHAAIALRRNSGNSGGSLSQPLVETWLRNLSTSLASSATCSRKTPGKALLEEIVESRPELMYLRDENGGTPLHFAASIGDIRGIRILLKEASSTALERNIKGHLPIHIASKKGHVNVVKEILQRDWYDAMDFLNQKGQNIFHVAAKNGKDKIVKYILQNKKLEKLLNEKDNNGNTPLHLASMNMHPKVMFCLARDSRIKLNLINNDGLTARDIVLLQRSMPPTFREMLSFTILYSSGASLSEKGKMIRRRHSVPPKMEWIKDRISTLLLVAILVATVTFAAGFSVPGGFHPPLEHNDSDHRAPGSPKRDDKFQGEAVMACTQMFQIYMICNTVAMYSSTIGSFILLWAQLGDFHIAWHATYLALYLVGLALVTMSLAFMAASNLIVIHHPWLKVAVDIIGFSFLSLFLLMFVLLIFPLGARRPLLVRHISYFIMRMIIPWSGSHGKVIDKRRKLTGKADQDSQPRQKE